MKNAKAAIREEIVKRKQELYTTLDDLIDLYQQKMYYTNAGDHSRTVDYVEGRISTYRNHENVLICGLAQLKRLYIMVAPEETIEKLQLDLSKSDFTKDLKNLRLRDCSLTIKNISSEMFEGYDRSIDEKNYA